MSRGARGRGGRRPAAPAAAGAGTRASVSASAGGKRELPFRVGDEVTADIVGLSHEGEGVGRAGGFTLFVHGALPGETVRARVTALKKSYGHAEVVERLADSADRVVPPCPVYESCGGCQLQHLAYEAQLRWKRQSVIDSLERIGKIRTTVRPTLGMADPWRYRNKAQVPIGEEEGGLVGGFYERGTHRIADMDECRIQSGENDAVVRAVKRIGRELGVSAYREDTHEGLLRHVVVRTAARTGEVMVVLVTNGTDLPHAEEWVTRIREAVPAVASICQNVNTRRTSLAFGPETRVLWGRDVVYDAIGDIRFAISPQSFYQVNPAQTEVLYGKALEYAGLTGEETVIDAYCGIGTISLFLARKARHVYGVEIVEEAVADARRNAGLNGIANATFACGPAELVLPRWRAEGVRADVVVVDPPRKGCDAALLETIVAMRPPRVVYVSCNPATLARDLRVLEDGGYRTVEAQPVDMFPHTVHVESVGLLVRNETVE